MSVESSEIKKSTEKLALEASAELEKKANSELFLTTSFHKKKKPPGPYEFTYLSHKVNLTAHYGGGIPVPRTPFFHPYHPTGTAEENQKNFAGYPGSVLAARFLGNFYENYFPYLPKSLKDVLLTLGLSLNNIELFFVVQNMPWKNETLLLRAHYWLHSDPSLDESIRNGAFSLDTPTRVGIFSPTMPEITCDNLKDMLADNPISNSSHPGSDEQDKVLMTIASPPDVGVLRGVDFDRTESFYSLVVVPSDGRAALTLHWMLNPNDQEMLTEISHFVNNMKEFIQMVARLKNSRLNIPDGPLSHLTTLLNTNVHSETNRIADIYIKFIYEKLEYQNLMNQKRETHFLSKQASQSALTLQYDTVKVEQEKKELIEKVDILQEKNTQLVAMTMLELNQVSKRNEILIKQKQESSPGLEAIVALLQEALKTLEEMEAQINKYRSLTDLNPMQTEHKALMLMDEKVQTLYSLKNDLMKDLDPELKKIVSI